MVSSTPNDRDMSLDEALSISSAVDGTDVSEPGGWVALGTPIT